MSEIRVDTITEKTSANGVAIDSLGIKDENDNSTWEQADATWKLIYDVLIYADADKRANKLEQTYRIKNRHVDHFKVDYSLDATDNPFKLAYADLKANDQLSNVKDV